jgi:predicted metal-dependent peptidase
MDNNEIRAELLVQEAAKRLLTKNPFYAHLMMTLERHINNRIPAMAVCIRGNNLCLDYNPTFINSMKEAPIKELMWLVQHEMLHIAYRHIQLSKSGLYTDNEIANIAMDYQINQHLPSEDMPNGHLSKEELFKRQREYFDGDMSKPILYPIFKPIEYTEHFDKEDTMKGSMWYYKELKKMEEENPGSVKGKEGTKSILDIDPEGISHEDLSEVDIIFQEATIGKWLKDAVSKAEESGKGRGTIPEDLKGWIDAMFSGKEESVSWKRVLKRFIQGAIKAESLPSRKRPSRRFGEGFPGSKMITKPRGMIYWDQSGSVSLEEHEMLFDELYHIYKTGVDIDITPFNAKCLDTYEYKGESKYSVTGGGTDFDVCQEHFGKVSSRYAFAVMFTDGEAPVPDKFSKPTVWIITNPRKMEEDYPGYQVLMKK